MGSGRGGVTVKLALAEPNGVVTVIRVEPCLAAREMIRTKEMEASVVMTPLGVIPGLFVLIRAPIKPLPVIVTFNSCPPKPLSGDMAVIVGAGIPPALRVIESKFPTAS